MIGLSSVPTEAMPPQASPFEVGVGMGAMAVRGCAFPTRTLSNANFETSKLRATY